MSPRASNKYTVSDHSRKNWIEKSDQAKRDTLHSIFSQGYREARRMAQYNGLTEDEFKQHAQERGFTYFKPIEDFNGRTKKILYEDMEERETDRLHITPVIRILAKEYGVSKSTIRRALLKFIDGDPDLSILRVETPRFREERKWQWGRHTRIRSAKMVNDIEVFIVRGEGADE